MVIQHILFPSPDTCMEEKMYFRRNSKTDFSLEKGELALKKGGFASFDTYFNGITAEKWYKYTNVSEINLKIKISGDVRVTAFRKEKIYNNISSEYVFEKNYSFNEPTEITIPFSDVSHNGIYSFSLFSTKNEAIFYGGCYCSDIPQEKVNPVKIAIDICTFKREKFIGANLSLMKRCFLDNTGSELNGHLEIFVSDNAGTIDIEKLSSDNIHIFKNKNAGGAGGFTRGMIEISKVREERSISHVLVMDDDICIEPEAIFRTFILLSCLKKEYSGAFIGGAMLRLDHRNIQTESGARWDGGDLISLKCGLDMNKLDAVLFNEHEETPQFNAWWYCAFPADVIKDDNLPLPIFIRGDDVEYGLRNMKNLILLNGICVWHEPFEYKYSSFLFYYILRNRLIDNSLHSMIMTKAEVKELLRRNVTEQLWIYRYKNADLLMDGVEDFLKGTEWLSKQDGEALHKSVTARGYKLRYLEEIEEKPEFVYGMFDRSLNEKFKTDLKSRVIRRLTINGHLLSVKRQYSIVPTIGAAAESCCRTEKILNYDYCSRKGFLTKRDKKKAKECLKRYKNLCAQIDRQYDKAVEDYRSNFRNLTNIDFWNRYLELDV